MSKNKKHKFVKPFVKWAGGKRQLLPEIRKYIPKKITTYYEPFVGGGAVLFDLKPKKFVINDVNSEIINVYQIIKTDVKALIEELKTYKNEADFYYEKRSLDRTKAYKTLSPVKKAARIIFLNKTCFNGLFRVNSQGQFNVPFGNYKKPNIVNEVTLKAVSNYLNESNGIILNKDFTQALEGIEKSSFVYFDPPYDPISDSSSFTGYTLNGFDRTYQQKLKALCDELNKKNCKFLLSNSATDFIKKIYKDYKIEIVRVPRSINSVASKRGKIDEVLIRNYE